MDLSSLPAAYAGRRVLVTGHTGFKGAWLCQWLLELGAKVHGLALAPAPRSLFEQLNLTARIQHQLGDVRDVDLVRTRLAEIRPEFIFHLAAQPLVRLSYREPVETFAVNTLGTANVLDAVRGAEFTCAVVVVTSDKCYLNHGQPRAFREEDALGGHDPYSASKAAAEIITASYRDSFFCHDTRVALASARAGNVIGGGDWAEDRIVPDAMRALEAGQPILVRNPEFTRPWQHVLEPLGGYLLLAARLEQARALSDRPEISKYARAFNFGPGQDANRTVRELVEEVLQHWPGRWNPGKQEKHLPEAPLLSLDIARARTELGWSPRWDFASTVARTAEWYRRSKDGEDALALTQGQIAEYAGSSSAREE